MQVSWNLAWQITVVAEPTSKILPLITLFSCWWLSGHSDKSQYKVALKSWTGAFFLAFLPSITNHS